MPAYRRLFARRALACLLATRPEVPPILKGDRDDWAARASHVYSETYPFTFGLFSPLILAVVLQILAILLKWWLKDRDARLIRMERAYLSWQVS